MINFNKKIIVDSILAFFKRHHKKIIFGFLSILIFFVFLSMNVAGNYIYNKVFLSVASDPSAITDSSNSSIGGTDSKCSVMGINLHGTLLTYIPKQNDNDPSANTDVVASENIDYSIQQANDDPKIKAIMIEVDSSGGLPVAGSEIASAIKNSSKPTVAVIRQSGLSAAYWAISSAEHIFASKNSDVGSIGVTSSYLDNSGKNAKDGITYVQLIAGKYKDAGNPDAPITEAEKQLFLRDLNIIHKNFIADIAANRNIPVADIQKIADGSSVLGEQAKALHLIDEIGGLPEAEKYLEDKIGEKPDVCWQ